MESLLMAALFAVIACAIIWIVVYLIETKLSPSSEIIWWARAIAIILTVLVLVRAFWPYVP